MEERAATGNAIMDKSFDFALKIIALGEELLAQRKYVVEHQLTKSGTSIGANVREAQNAESKSDFIHKMKIAAKEADETKYWLELCKYSENYPSCDNLLNELEQIRFILNSIIGTSKRNSLE